MYTKSKLVDDDRNEKTVLTFGPVCILPKYKTLIAHSFEKAREMGYDAVVIFGSPSNYVGLGFKSCKKYNVGVDGGKYPAAMLVKELADNVFDGRKWNYIGSPAMDIDEKEAERFDDGLKKMEKKFQPSQEEFYILSSSFVQ